MGFWTGTFDDNKFSKMQDEHLSLWSWLGDSDAKKEQERRRGGWSGSGKHAKGGKHGKGKGGKK